jgi:hypothetical protein
MAIRWACKAQCVLEKNLLGRGFQEILTSDDMGNTQMLVIDHGGQMVGVDFISTKKDEVPCERLERPFGPSLDGIVKAHRLVRDLNAKGVFTGTKRRSYFSATPWTCAIGVARHDGNVPPRAFTGIRQTLTLK